MFVKEINLYGLILFIILLVLAFQKARSIVYFRNLGSCRTAAWGLEFTLEKGYNEVKKKKVNKFKRMKNT